MRTELTEDVVTNGAAKGTLFSRSACWRLSNHALRLVPPSTTIPNLLRAITNQLDSTGFSDTAITARAASEATNEGVMQTLTAGEVQRWWFGISCCGLLAYLCAVTKSAAQYIMQAITPPSSLLPPYSSTVLAATTVTPASVASTASVAASLKGTSAASEVTADFVAPVKFELSDQHAGPGALYGILTPLACNQRGDLSKRGLTASHSHCCTKAIGISSSLKQMTLRKGPLGSSEQQDFVGAALDRVHTAGYIAAAIIAFSDGQEGVILRLNVWRVDSALYDTETFLKSTIIDPAYRFQQKQEYLRGEVGDAHIDRVNVDLDISCHFHKRISTPKLVKIYSDTGAEKAQAQGGNMLVRGINGNIYKYTVDEYVSTLESAWTWEHSGVENWSFK